MHLGLKPYSIVIIVAVGCHYKGGGLMHKPVKRIIFSRIYKKMKKKRYQGLSESLLLLFSYFDGGLTHCGGGGGGGMVLVVCH